MPCSDTHFIPILDELSPVRKPTPPPAKSSSTPRTIILKIIKNS